jgi:hypothetical protein
MFKDVGCGITTAESGCTNEGNIRIVLELAKRWESSTWSQYVECSLTNLPLMREVVMAYTLLSGGVSGRG